MSKKNDEYPKMITSGLVSPGPTQSFGPEGPVIIYDADYQSRSSIIISGLFAASLIVACIIMLLIQK